MKFKETYEAIKKKPFLLAIPAFFDLVAMLLFGYTLIDIQNRALIVIVDLQALFEKTTDLTMQALNESNLIEMFSQQTDLVGLESALIKLLLILIVAFWLVWLLFQGGSWRWASLISGNKTKYFKFMSRFILVNLVWLSLLTVVNVFLLNHQFSLQLEFHKTFLDFLTVIGVILNLVIAYFMFISYGLISKYKLKNLFKNTFKIGFEKPFNVLLVYLVIVGGIGVIDLLLRLFGLISPTAAFIFGILILLPYLTIARVFLIKSIENL